MLAMENSSLDFVASMTVCPSDIRKITKHLHLSKSSFNAIPNVLITPLFASKGSLKLVEEMAEQGTSVFFDSGGYYVQMGRLKYEELYMPLRESYKVNRWASVYTLPDHVPTSQDTPEVVEQKVKDTIDYSTLFFHEMPDDLKPRAMPVIQGHTYKQIDACLEAYIRLGVKRIGFGSFGTSGKNSEVNIATNDAVTLAAYVIDIAHSHAMKVHLFGLGVPALVAMIKGIGADSFDSSSWLKSAGFGQIFLPFMRSYSISHNYTTSEFQKGLTIPQFEDLRNLTGHSCELCNSLHELQNCKMYRAAHNLIVMMETVEMANSGDYSHIRNIYNLGSNRYRKEFEKWLQPN